MKRTYTSPPQVFSRFCSLALTALMALSLSACLPSGEQEVNSDLFKDRTEMASKADTLRPGMSKHQVFETLNVPLDKFERLSLEEMQTCYYGNAVVQGTPQQLEEFRRRMLHMEGYSLPYREIKSSSSLGLGKMKVEKTGYDLRLVLVFDKGNLVHSNVEGTHNVRLNEDRYMWDSLINRGIGAAF